MKAIRKLLKYTGIVSGFLIAGVIFIGAFEELQSRRGWYQRSPMTAKLSD